MRLLIFLVFMTSAYGLEIDEKLTARFIKVSESRKTILLNRGLEDGLVVGDHAKFFLTTGVIARGQVVKASPTRSIWALYRIIDGTKVFSNKVVNIKIASPVKVTDDPSKALKPDMVPQGVEVVKGEESLVNETEMDDLSKADKDDLADIQNGKDTMVDYDMGGSTLSHRSLEIFGLLHFSSLSSSVDQNTSGSYSGSDSNLNFTIGLEKYFLDSASFFRKVSFSVFLHKNDSTTTSISNQSISIGVFEYGLGLNYHFTESPRSNQLIYFGHLGGGIGTVTDTSQALSSSSTQETSVEGSNTFFQVGLGAKYYLSGGLGFRAILDYYTRSESYTFDDTGEEYTKSVSGPRVLLGLSFRF